MTMMTQTFPAQSARGGRFGQFAREVLQTMQTARMLQTLTAMRDDQLEEIGITREEIPGYAVKLVRGEA